MTHSFIPRSKDNKCAVCEGRREEHTREYDPETGKYAAVMRGTEGK